MIHKYILIIILFLKSIPEKMKLVISQLDQLVGFWTYTGDI